MIREKVMGGVDRERERERDRDGEEFLQGSDVVGD